VSLVPLRDRDDQPEVRVDHPLLRRRVASLDPLGELDLLLGGQERPASRLVQEELKRVRRRDREVAVHVGALLALAAAVVAQLDPALLGLVVERPHLILVQLVLGHELVHARELQAALVLPLGEQGSDQLMHMLGHLVPSYP
jgi:hypothetical protein